MHRPKRHIPKSMGDLIVGEIVIIIVFLLLWLTYPVEPLNVVFEYERSQFITESIPHDF